MVIGNLESQRYDVYAADGNNNGDILERQLSFSHLNAQFYLNAVPEVNCKPIELLNVGDHTYFETRMSGPCAINKRYKIVRVTPE